MANANRSAEEFVTRTGHALTEPDPEALADEAECGYDLSGQPPTLAGLWIAELISTSGEVKARLVLTSRSDAEEALSARWRVVRYVRADLAQ